MDQTRSEGKSEVLDPVREGVNKNLSLSVEGVAIDAVDGGSLGDRVSISGEVGTSGEMCKDSGSNKELKDVPEEVKVQDKVDQVNIIDKLPGIDQGTSYNSNNFVNQEVLETVVVIESVQTEYVNRDNRKSEAKANESELNLLSMKAQKGMSETDKNSFVIDMKSSSRKGFCENSEGERICRICHLAPDATTVGSANSATSADLIQLGCACKDELGIAHIHCAEAWFKLKGNRLCEICGETAKNVSGVANNGFMEEWNERRFRNNDGNPCGCWRGQPFCNFLMACLVIAFVLPWFFRVNMF
ncbi:uncharacterized protein LOC133288902 [Gastrolobium bilobum]|uniref:uncharacterized protein LOC133288902 n=1 Tax=Gastrolobium bilobum TaxID=150636 RepID=UPI002AB1E723|nr:uncharacterized protein LOC133288902 [Gastrolobium bilobum]XP_061342720.1 uncharacterized protein LOC133288902 [Gastrolobium bilobum]